MSEARSDGQEQLAAARRAQILDAATRVFAEKGFHRATIRDIARAAGLADGTIYIYFASKADLLIGLLDRLNETERRPEDLAQVAGPDFRSVFVAYLRHRLTVVREGLGMLRAVLPELLVNLELREVYFRQVIGPTLELGERYMTSLIEQGQIRPMDPSLAVRAISGQILGLLLLRMLGDEQIEARWEDLPEHLATLLLDGLRPAAGTDSTGTAGAGERD